MGYPLTIAQIGQPILRQSAQPINDHDLISKKFQTLIDDLIMTAVQADGVGLAAPQVSQSYRLLIIASRPNARYPYAPVMEPTAMINPSIITHSSEIVKGWEGCLSVPDLRGWVPRYRSVSVAYCDRHGHSQQQELTDFVARIFQHELDHLNGIVFPDRIDRPEDLISETDYCRLMDDVKGQH